MTLNGTQLSASWTPAFAGVTLSLTGVTLSLMSFPLSSYNVIPAKAGIYNHLWCGMIIYNHL